MKVERRLDVTRVRYRALLTSVAFAAGVLTTSCGNLTAGGATGETSVFVAGDAPDPATVSAASSTAHPPARSSGSDDEPEGELELRFLVSLVSPDGSTLPLTAEEARIRVEFPERQEKEVVSRAIPAGPYAALRVTFTDIEAEVDAGLVVEGDTITGAVEVELESDSLVVERPLDLDLGDGSRAELVVDMNTSSWLTAVDPDLHTVAGTLVADVIEVHRR